MKGVESAGEVNRFVGAEFLIPDLDPRDTPYQKPEQFTLLELGAFYDAFWERFRYDYLEVAQSILLRTKKRQTLKIKVRRRDPTTYVFTTYLGDWRPTKNG